MAGVTCVKLVFDVGTGWGWGFAHINVYYMVVYANDITFSVVLDVHAISLANVHGTSR